MDLLTSKIITMTLLFVVALFFGLLPLKVRPMILKGDDNSRRKRRRERFISGLLCVGAGVLLATVFIHMLPETREAFEKARKAGLLGSHDDHDHHDHDHKELLHLHLEKNFKGNGSEIPLDYPRRFPNDNEYSGHSEHNHGSHDHGSHDHGSHNHGKPTLALKDDEIVIALLPTHDHGHSNHNDTESTDVKNLHGKASSSSNGNESSMHGNEHHNHSNTDFPFEHDHHNHDHDHHNHDNHNHDHDHHDHDHHNHDHDHHNHDHDHHNHDGPIGNDKSNHSHATNNDSKLLELDNHDASKPQSNQPTMRTPLTPQHDETAFFENTINPGEKAHPKDHLHRHDPRFEALLHEAQAQTLHENHTGDHDHHDHDHDDHGYPFAELTICLGFIFIYFIEEFVHKACLQPKTPYEGADGGHQHGHGHSHMPKFSRSEKGSLKNGGLHSPVNGHAHVISNGDAIAIYDKSMSPQSDWGAHGVDNPVFAGDVEATNSQRIRTIMLSNSKVLPITSTPSPAQPHLSNGNSTQFHLASADLNKSTLDYDEKRSSRCHIGLNLHALLIVLALGFHELFEGMAVGLQEYTNDVWYLFVAISAHKYVIMFCMGLEFLEDNTSKLQTILSMFILALLTPIGMSIGILVTENSQFGGAEHVLIIAVLNGLAAGTILYVAFLEILERERTKPGGRLVKLFCLVIGFALMAVVQAFGGHSH